MGLYEDIEGKCGKKGLALSAFFPHFPSIASYKANYLYQYQAEARSLCYNIMGLIMQFSHSQ